MPADPLTAAWEAVAPAAGLPARPRPVIVSDRGAGAARRITARLDRPEGALALRISPGAEPGRWRRAEAGARAMHAALSARPLDHAPRVLASHEGARAILSDWAPGATLLETMLSARTDAALAGPIRDAARWAGALHAETALPAGPVRPGGPLSWVRRLREGAAPPDPDLLDRALAMLAGEADAMSGTAPRASHHGDLHAANLIVDGAHVTGIDPELPEEAPTARDLAYLLTDVSVRMAPRLPGGVLLPEPLMGRVLAAYGRDPGPLLYFARVRLVWFWLAVPADPSRRTLRREQVWQGIRARRGALFAGL